MPRILIVDDSRSVQEFIESVLAKAGHQVLTSESTAQIEPLLSSEALDLIVTDIYMPGADGLELIRMRNRLCPQVAVLAVSGKAGVYDMLPVAKLIGANATLQKPFSRESLLSVVNSLIDQQQAETHCHG